MTEYESEEDYLVVRITAFVDDWFQFYGDKDRFGCLVARRPSPERLQLFYRFYKELTAIYINRENDCNHRYECFQFRPYLQSNSKFEQYLTENYHGNDHIFSE